MEKIVIANHKNYLKKEDVDAYVKKINALKKNNIKLYVAPSNSNLKCFISDNYHLTMQDISLEEDLFDKIRELNIDTVIIGHSDQRKNGDDYKIINKKIRYALLNNLNVILCINEINTMYELRKDLKYVKDFNRIIIAYEPEYAIESGKSASGYEIDKIKHAIKKEFKVKFVYGGSVNKTNIEKIIKKTNGVIIGKTSSNVKEFTDLVSKI